MAVKIEFMKVRHYIVDAIAASNGTPLRFPPTRKLGEMLNVSQPTALRAVKDLIAEGFLTSAPGGGTVSCPTASIWDDIKIFGMLINLGKQSFYDHYFMAVTSAVGLEITRRNKSYCIQEIYLESPSLLERTVQEDSISAVVLFPYKDTIAESALKLKTKGIPVASFMKYFKGISSFYSPDDKRFENILKMLFGEKRTHILVVSWPDEYFVTGIQAGIRSACKKCNIPEGQVMYLHDDLKASRAKVKEMFDFGVKFDAVVFYPFDHGIYDMVKSRSAADECRFVCDELSVFDDMEYTGYAVEFDLKGAAKALVDNLLEQMNNPGAPPVDTTVGYKIKSYIKGKVQ